MFIAPETRRSALRRRAMWCRELTQLCSFLECTDGHGPPNGGQTATPIPAINIALLRRAERPTELWLSPISQLPRDVIR